MKMFHYFLKKALDNKLSLFLHALILTIGIFLAAMFLTLGFNAVGQTAGLLEREPNNRILTVKPQSGNDLFSLLTADGLECRATAVRENTEFLKELCGKSLELPVSEFQSGSDPVYLAENLLAGSAEPVSSGLWIGKSILDMNELSVDEVLGGEAVLMNSGPRRITGVLDDRDELVSAGCVVFTDEYFAPDLYYLDPGRVDRVEPLLNHLENEGFTVYSHIEQIRSAQSYGKLIQLTVLLTAVFIIAAFSIILYGALKGLLEEKYPYLALLKSIGYQKKHYQLYVFTESMSIFIPAAVLALVLYIAGFELLSKIFAAAGVRDLFGLGIGALFMTSFGMFALSILFALAALFAVSLLCVRFIDEKQTYEILFEANQ